MKHQITKEMIMDYREYLVREEYASDTIKKYLGDSMAFLTWLKERTDSEKKAGKAGQLTLKSEPFREVEINKEAAADWKAHLVEEGRASSTVNAMLSSLNRLLGYLGWEECKVKFLKIQRRAFRDQEKELNRVEYGRLVETAEKTGNHRLALLLETVCATGIRVSELRYITLENVARRRADIALKGKIRTIFLPGKLCKKLTDYARRRNITSGEIFLTRSGRGISRRQVWQEMKNLCKEAKVNPEKVFCG